MFQYQQDQGNKMATGMGNASSDPLLGLFLTEKETRKKNTQKTSTRQQEKIPKINV